MSTSSVELGPFLVSDLPPVPRRPRLVTEIRERIVARWQERAFERALDEFGHAQQAELIALARRR